MNDYAIDSEPEAKRVTLHCYDPARWSGCSAPAVKTGSKLDSNGKRRIVRLYGAPTPHEFVEMRNMAKRSGTSLFEWAPIYRCTVCGAERRHG